MNGDWHLDKRVSLALIFTLLLNVGGTMYSVGRIVNMVETNVKAIQENKTSIASHVLVCDSRNQDINQRVNSQEATLARIDERTKAIQSSVEEIKKSRP